MNGITGAAILAGGLSQRMGRDKSFVEFNGEPMIRCTARVLESLFESVIVVTKCESVAVAARLPFVTDSHLNKGPLAGVEAALKYFDGAVFVIACDMPFLSPDFIRFQCDSWRPSMSVLAAQSDNGIEPLHAIWSYSVLDALGCYLEADRVPSLRRVSGSLDSSYLAVEDARHFDAQLRCFENWNSPEDVANSAL